MMAFLISAVSLVLVICSNGFAATKESSPPDREMLRMMDLLREMEMIKQIDMLQEMRDLNNGGDQTKTAAPQKSASGKLKETAK